MTLAAIAIVFEKHEARGSHVDQIWRQVAFLGRYAHQQAPNVLKMTTPDVGRLVKAVGQLLDEEHRAVKKR